MHKNAPQRIIVLGAGNFGTCLAQHLAEKGHLVTLWARSRIVSEAINLEKQNPRYLSHIRLHANISSVDVLSPALIKEFSTIVLAIPTQFIRSVLSAYRSKIHQDQLVVSAIKGIEQGSLCLPAELIASSLEYPRKKTVFLSGPSFASEVAEGQPTAVTMASLDETAVRKGQAVFHSPRFRVYTSLDPTGVEIAGALKNVVAIAAGACVGLGFKSNALSALITRGLAELTRFGVALGANPLTFNGLGGVGDLFLTCSSKKSRNFTVGFRLAQGESLEKIMKTLGSVAEGVATTKAAYELGLKQGVRMSITIAVYRVLYENVKVQQAVEDLLNASSRQEFE